MITSAGVFGDALSPADDPCAIPPSNRIACENSQPGNPASEWDITGAGSASIQGFATSISVDRGQTVRFKVNTPASAYRLDIYRLGYYGGSGARKIVTILPSVALPQAQPACTTDSATGLVDCGVWNISASWAVPATAVSGVYIAKLVRTDGPSGSSHIVFVVRDDAGQSDLLFQTSDTTWQAYNSFGGNSLYAGDPAGRAYKVSYNRPFSTRATNPENWVFHAEYPMIRWLEANGYDVSYTTGVDTDRRGAELLEHKAFLSVGQDQYWSHVQRDNVEAARAAGVNLAFFGGRSVFWKTRWEPSIDGGNVSHRTLVCYKETHANQKLDPQALVWTGTWRDPRFSPPADGGHPENALTGTMFSALAGAPSGIEVPAEAARQRFWRHTSVAALLPGQMATLVTGSLGYEWDEAPDESRPSGLVTLSRTRRAVPYKLLDYGSSYGFGMATHSLTLYRDAASRALVFSAGTGQWSWGLDVGLDRAPSTTDLRIKQSTMNLLADMGAQPITPQDGLIASDPSDDDLPPVSSIVSPVPDAVLLRGSPIVIQGTASDASGQVAQVEVSTDGGQTWRAASGTTSWTYQWTPQTAGTIVLLSRAYDDNANLETPGSGARVTVNAPAPGSCPCTIWHPSTVPSTPDSGGDNAVELGVKFQSSARGYITAVRFYKSDANTGVHTGNLWTTSGTLLARVTFTNETASGWQTASFSQPVPVEPDTTYVASYHTTAGHYAFSPRYFSSLGVENGTLRALANGVTANGVYRYSATTTFPQSSYLEANYWVDVVFQTNANDTAPPTVVRTAPSAGALASTSAQVAVTFSEALNGASVHGATFELRDGSGAVVPSSVSHASAREVLLTPSAPLQAPGSYSVRVRGGSGGVTDLAGHPLAADYAWTFSTGAAATAPDQGPGGPILIVAAPENPFARYYAEILRAEGLNAFAVMDLAQVTPAVLSQHDVVLLGNIPLTTAQVTMLTTWVSDGGRLIAMRPDKKLAALLGITDAGAVLSDQYLRIDTTLAPGTGLVDQTIQFHGQADLYDAPDATTLATLYSSATASTSRPAVTMRHVGANGGRAAAFTYDLARSVVYTRQGNPAWAGQERDGIAPIRPNDMFWGGSSSPDWIDLDKVAIPQADEQQRLLANLILTLNITRRPLPRFWYLPRGSKAAVIMTSDDHGHNGTAPRFASYLELSPAGCSVDDWECVRATSYIYTNTPLPAGEARGLEELGFEVGLHVNTGCVDYSPSSLATTFASQLGQWRTKYTTLRSPATNRTHCMAWSDWGSHIVSSAANGVRLDTNYYYWPGGWTANRPGMFTGSGMPMRFATSSGVIRDVYQAATQITDESDQVIPATIDALLDRALGPEGYYGVFTANMHADFAPSDGAAAIVASSRQRGVPVVSAHQMLEWLDGRNATTYSDLTWNGTVLTFRIGLGAGARGLEAMVPATVDGFRVSAITADGAPIAFREETIKGIRYAMFRAASAAFQVTYVHPPDRLHGVVTDANSGAPLANVTVSAYAANGAHVASGFTDAAGAYRAEGLAPGTYFVGTDNARGYVDQVFSGISCGASCPMTSGTAVTVTGTGPIPPVSFALVRERPEMVYPTANAVDVLLSRNFEWTPVPGADAYIIHIGTAPDTWDVLADGLLTAVTHRVTRTLPSDRTLYVRVGARAGGVWRFGQSIPFRAAATTATLVYPAANATGVLLSRDFEWNAVPGADAYILHVGTSPNTWNVLAAGLLSGTTYRVTTALPSGTTLHARVGARVGGIWRWGASNAFTVAQLAPSMIYPTANATDIVQTRDFQWTTVAGADAYILHVGTAPNTWDLLAAGLLTSSSYRVTTALPTDRTLYARVGARVDGVWWWTSSTPFRAVRPTATMVYPIANATDVVITRDFEWTPVSNADAYILHVGTAPGTWDLVAAGLLTQTSYRIRTILPPDRTLYVRVGARVGGVWWWGASIPFRVRGGTATMVYPTANATDVLLTRNFEWTAVPFADAYILHIGTAPNTWDVLADGWLTATSYRVGVALPSDRTLYVRVGARVGGVWWWADSIPFTAARLTATLLYPIANATDVVITRDFEWTAVAGADAYVLHIGTAPNTWDVVAAGLLTTTSYRVTTALPTDRPLYARVGARVGGVWWYAASIPFNVSP